VNAARVGKLSRERDVAIEIDFLDIGRSVESIDFRERNSLETLFSFGMFADGRFECLPLPALLL
jgi:hypothetical protein